jgi:hypothetical protein
MNARTLEEKLEWALAGKARWEAKMAQADARYEQAHEMGGGIPGFGGSGNQRAAQQVRSAFDSADRAWREASEKLEYYTSKARGYQRRIEERDRVRLTRDDVLGATAVRTTLANRWLPVVRVNRVTVTVNGLWPWPEPVKFEHILDVRTVTK